MAGAYTRSREIGWAPTTGTSAARRGAASAWSNIWRVERHNGGMSGVTNILLAFSIDGTPFFGPLTARVEWLSVRDAMSSG